jgi:hypothetical protein
MENVAAMPRAPFFFGARLQTKEFALMKSKRKPPTKFIDAGTATRDEGSGTTNFKGVAPESWCCVDCGINTAPGLPTRVEVERAYRTSVAVKKLTGQETPFPMMELNEYSEVYAVHETVWKAAGMEPLGGCLCIRHLEERLGRQLQPKDFPRRHPNNGPHLPCTLRLWQRRFGDEGSETGQP